MKKKDIFYLAIAAAIFAIVGMVLYSHFTTKSGDQGVTQVEVVAPIAASFDKNALDILADPAKVTKPEQAK